MWDIKVAICCYSSFTSGQYLQECTAQPSVPYDHGSSIMLLNTALEMVGRAGTDHKRPWRLLKSKRKRKSEVRLSWWNSLTMLKSLKIQYASRQSLGFYWLFLKKFQQLLASMEWEALWNLRRLDKTGYFFLFNCFLLDEEGKMDLWAGIHNICIRFLLVVQVSYVNSYSPAFFQLQKWEYFLYLTTYPIHLFACMLLSVFLSWCLP